MPHRWKSTVSRIGIYCLTTVTSLLVIYKIVSLKDVTDLLDHSNSELSDKLCRIGDRIVFKLVQWTRRLPFYTEIPVEIHTRLLTNKWHELLVLTTSAFQAINGNRMGTTYSDGATAEPHQEVSVQS